MNIPCIGIKGGGKHPVVGFGTYKVGYIPASASSAVATSHSGVLQDQNVESIINDALKVGYRMFDCAEYYGNEQMIGKALHVSGIPREDLFIASKVWSTTIYEGPEAVRAQVLKSLEDLQAPYLDLELVHWPVPNGKHVAAYKTLLEMKDEGYIRAVGVSNYTIADLQELEANGLPMPAVNQIEINPFCFRKDTIAFCEQHDIRLQAYRALANGLKFGHPAVSAIASKHQVSPAQVLGRWCVQHGFLFFPKSVKVERMRENCGVFDFELDTDDMLALDNLTTEESMSSAAMKYRQGIVRDTPLEGNLELGEKNSRITVFR